MASGTDYLKEYLIKVGWDFDKNAMKLTGDEIKNFVSNTISSINEVRESYSLATKVALNGIFKITGAVVGLLDKQAQLGESIDKQAKRFWTTAENWRAFSTSLETLGIKYEDLFFTTQEELNKFRELYAFSKSLEVPKGINDTLVTIRSIRQEFNKLQVLVQYFFRALTYYIGENTKDELLYWRNTLREFVKFAAQKMPEVARVLARALSLILNVMSAVGRVFVNVIKPIIKWISEIPNHIKLIGFILSLSLLGPLGKIIAAITIIMLLIEDYMYWKAGKHSAFDWGVFDEKVGSFKEKFDELKGTFSDLKNEFNDFKEQIKPFLDELKKDAKFLAIEALKMAFDSLLYVVDQVVDGLKNIVDLVEVIRGEKSFMEYAEDLTGRTFEYKEGSLVDKMIDALVGAENRKDKEIPSITDPDVREKYINEHKDDSGVKLTEFVAKAFTWLRDKSVTASKKYNDYMNAPAIESDAQVLRTSGILTNTRERGGTRNSNINIDSHDIFNVNSVDEANSIIAESQRRIVNAMNNELSPVLR